jgi:hypothetical protein
MVYYHHVSQVQPGGEDDPTVEEQIEQFDEQIGQRVSANAKAEEMMRANMILRGLDPDAEPELSPELEAMMQESLYKSDTDLYFSGKLDKEIRGKKITGKDDDFG